jgi:pilus assembly protein CpaB
VRRRILATVVALLLAATGTVVLIAYVDAADSRALAGVRTVDVLVVAEPIAAGTPGAEVADLVTTRTLPATAAVTGRVTDLSSIDGMVATVDLQPGEQLLAGRFAGPDTLAAPGTVAVPDGDQEVSVLLEPARAVGGRLAAGDRVGVLISLDPPSTHAVLHRVLVTQVQGAPAAVPEDSADTDPAAAGTPAPDASLMVTLAVSAAQAESVVFGAEHGTLWLTLEPDGAQVDGTEVVTPDNVYERDLP